MNNKDVLNGQIRDLMSLIMMNPEYANLRAYVASLQYTICRNEDQYHISYILGEEQASEIVKMAKEVANKCKKTDRQVISEVFAAIIYIIIGRENEQNEFMMAEKIQEPYEVINYIGKLTSWGYGDKVLGLHYVSMEFKNSISFDRGIWKKFNTFYNE